MVLPHLHANVIFFYPHLPIISWWLVCSILDQKVRCSPGFVTGKSPALLVYWWFIGGKLKGRVVPLLALVLYMESHSLFTGTPGARVYDQSFTFFYFTPRNIFSEEKEHKVELHLWTSSRMWSMTLLFGVIWISNSENESKRRLC